MKIAVIGTGFVGVVSAAVYASFGHEVVGLDIDQRKIDSLRQGKVPFFEPELEELLVKQQAKKNLSFTTTYKEAIAKAAVVIIAVGTPSAPDGQADLTYVLAAAESLSEYLEKDTIVAIKSTVPPGTLSKVKNIIKRKTKTQFHTASLPEFLKEGTAVHDTLNPDRVVIGVENDFSFKKLVDLHKPLQTEIIRVSPESAQMGKYTANAYLALRITFINQIADLCEKNGADINEVIQVIGKDSRVGEHYWYPGFGYGGSCFPKDVNELAAYSRSVGEADNLLNKISDLNKNRILKLMAKYAQMIGDWEGKTVAVLGLSFKPNTNDMREAPSIKVIPYLLDHGAKVSAYDPKAESVADHFITPHQNLTYMESLNKTVKDADVIMALIEWPEILKFDFPKYKPKKKAVWFIDARNQFDPKLLTNAGYHYINIGNSEYAA